VLSIGTMALVYADEPLEEIMYPPTAEVTLNDLLIYLDEALEIRRQHQEDIQEFHQSMKAQIESINNYLEYAYKIYLWGLAIITVNLAFNAIKIFAIPWGNN
jgi:hypothetical protein